MIRGLIFDFGRVISAQKPPSLFHRYEEDLGLAKDSINRIMFQCSEWQDALRGQMTLEEYWNIVGRSLGLHSTEQVECFRRRYEGDEKPDSHVKHLLRRLAGRFKLSVCSNSPPGLHRWLAHWHLEELFEVVFCSGEEGVVKPERAAYAITLSRMDLEPQEAVFVDDTWENVVAASDLGLHAILFTDGPALEEELSRFFRL